MSEERKRILKMLAEGKISLDEADELLAAFQKRPTVDHPTAGESEKAGAAVKTKPRFLRVQISGGEKEKVNVRVPLGLVNAGMRFGSLLPAAAREKLEEAMRSKGVPFDFNRMKPDEMLTVLEELDINIEDGGDHVRVFCE